MKASHVPPSFLSPESRRQGLQMTVVVVAAYLASLVAGLPEHVWAVMSALIVARPNVASTLDAAWDRTRSTCLGVACGLTGVGLARLGVGVAVSTLGIVVLLAYVSASLPTLRGAPIAALIVLSSAELTGSAALHVALVRVMQIIIGVVVAVVVSGESSRYRAADRLKTGCARLLRRAAGQVTEASMHAQSNNVDMERVRAVTRSALIRLASLARSSDRVSRLVRRTAPAAPARYHQRIAVLTGQILHDVSMLDRVLRTEACEGWCERQQVAAIGAAIANVANAIEGAGNRDLDELHELAIDSLVPRDSGGPPTAAAALLAGPLHLLSEDLRQLCRHLGARAKQSAGIAAQSAGVVP